jgi:hypothetical protein
VRKMVFCYRDIVSPCLNPVNSTGIEYTSISGSVPVTLDDPGEAMNMSPNGT